MDMKYLTLRKQLDELGYCENLSIDCLPLIENLTADLLQTTRSLQHYMNLAKETLKERDALKCAAEPYICDNAKLVMENNRAHHELVTIKEEFDRCMKEANGKIRKLENELSELEFEHRNLQSRNRDRELKNLCADTFSSRSKHVTNFSRTCCSQKSKTDRSSDEACICNKKSCSMCSELQSEIESLTKNNNESRNKSMKLLDEIAFLTCQVHNRDKENARLTKLLEGGRPFSALQKDCCGKDLDSKLVQMSRELQEKENIVEELNTKLKESLDKQHEAMNRAIQLADRNSILEKELCNIDQLALKIECECNEQLQDKCNTISHLHMQMENDKSKFRKQEKYIDEIKESLCVLEAELEAKRHENSALNIALVSSNDFREKIEKENEILKSQCKSVQIASKTESESSKYNPSKNYKIFDLHSVSKEKNCKFQETTSRDELLLLLERERKLYETQINDVKKQLADVTKFECRFPNTVQVCSNCEKIKEERDFYFKKSLIMQPHEIFTAELKSKNCELEQQIRSLKKQNDVLLENNNSLKSCLEQANKIPRNIDVEMENYMQLAINKLERDLKRAHGDIQCLEEERNRLRCKLITSATSSVNREDTDLRELSFQLRNSNNLYGRKSPMVENLIKEREDLGEKLKGMESELLHVKSLNNQLKTLQLENDKNIAENQASFFEAKREIRELREKIRALEKCKAELEYEYQILKSDKMTLKDTVTKIDQDRDKLIMDIDDKTERLSTADNELRSKNTSIEILENKIRELNKKLDLLTLSNASLEHKVRDSQTRNEAISIELSTISTQRDNALIENKRLQSDLATVNNDLRTINREYENSRKEVEQMKQQLQHYVDEVRRIEDILSRKEAERTDMLDNFASLSHEATVLENNNHSLENESASKSVQLQVTIERLNDIEKKVESREALIDMQETKMASLIYNISKLECELSQQKDLTAMAEKNLEYARETCATLEKQKKAILIGVGETDSDRKQLEYNLRSIKGEKAKIEENYAKDRATVESLESLLDSSRREVVELKLQLQEAREETRILKDKVEHLQCRLKKVEGESYSSRQRSEEAAKNLQDLKWQINDQRFQRLRTLEQQSSSKQCSGTL